MTGEIHEILPLAPGQGGILFHALTGGAPGEYVVQVVLDVTGAIDPAREQASWNALVARHDVLRTAFAWAGLKQPVQAVGKRAVPEVRIEDLSALSADRQQTTFAAWLAADRARGFDLSHAPLLRVTRFVLGPERHRIVVTFHHIAFDGWSVPVLLRNWVALYAGRALPQARAFRDLLAWAHAQDHQTAQDFWAAELAGFDPAPPLPSNPTEDRRGDLELALSQGEIELLRRMTRRAGATLASAVHGAWGLVMGRWTGRGDVAYGLARSCRPAALPGVENRAGMFLNTLPMRIRLTPDQPVADWLAGLHGRQMAQAPYEHADLSRIQSAHAARHPLFYSAVAFENYPTDPGLLGQIPGCTIHGIDIQEQTSLPLTLFAREADGLRLRLLFDKGVVSPETANGLLGAAADALRQMSEAPDMGLDQIRLTLPPAPSQAEPSLPAMPAAPDDLVTRLSTLWADLLDCPKPGEGDNFFDLGGHSILAITLQDRIRRDFGITVQIPDLFRFATLNAQASHLAHLRSGATDTGPNARTEARASGRDRLRRRARTQTKDHTENV